MGERPGWVAVGGEVVFVEPVGLAGRVVEAGGDDVFHRCQRRLHTLQVAFKLGVLVVGQLHLSDGDAQIGQVVVEAAGDWVARPARLREIVARARRQRRRQSQRRGVVPAAASEHRARATVVEDHDVGIGQEIARRPRLWFRERIRAARAGLLAVAGVGRRTPIVADAAVQVGVGVAVEVHPPGVEPRSGSQAIGIQSGDDPQADVVGRVLGICFKIGQQL